MVTSPLGAAVRIDGVQEQQHTPALFFLPAGEHEVVVHKLGYGDGLATVVVARDQVETVSWDLATGAIEISLPEESEAVVSDGLRNISESYVSLPDGEYRIARRESAVRIDPVYPKQRALTNARVAAVVSLVAAGILSADYAIRGDGPIYEEPLLMTSYIATAGAASAVTALTLRRGRYLARHRALVRPISNLETAPAREAELAEAELAAGNLEAALSRYIGLVEEYPETVLIPEALFRISRIHTLTNRIGTALLTLRTLIDDYPHPDVYDRACKNAADLLFSRRRYEESLAYLDRMLFVDPFYSREEIAEYRRLIEDEGVSGSVPGAGSTLP